MASASSTSAKNLFIDSKTRLAERVQVNVNNIASISRQINRGSQSSDMLTHAARNMALQDHAMKNTEENLQKIMLLQIHLGYQLESIQRSAITLENVKEQISLEFSGGAELLVNGIKLHEVNLEGNDWTIRKLLKWIGNTLIQERLELFLQKESVRPGILVLVNDADWELFGELDYKLVEDDKIVFISTLHGG